MKLNLRAKSTIALVVIIAVAVVACGARMYVDASKAAEQKAQEEAQAQAETVGNITFTSMDDQAAELFGGKEMVATLQNGVGEWCSRNVPDATEAQWSGTVEFDYRAKSVKALYTLNDKKATRIEVTAFPENGQYSVKKAV